jgi:hypothetical protein
MRSARLEKVFPYLQETGYRLTSPETINYNCIAWAAGKTNRCWWPDPGGIEYWPRGVPREVTIAAFIQAYAKHGFRVCVSPELEPGYQKIAIYADGNEPTHAARQLPNGKWTSKCGNLQDIEHNIPEGVCGSHYGDVVVYMKRPLRRVKSRKFRHGRWLKLHIRRAQRRRQSR